MTIPPGSAETVRVSLDELLTKRLQRWRLTVGVASAVVVTLVVADYLASGAARERLVASGDALRAATAAQALAWRGESAVRAFALRDDPGAPARADAARTGLRRQLEELRSLVADDAGSLAQLDSLAADIGAWDARIVVPLLAGAPLTRELATDATVRFDAISHHFEALVSQQSAARADALRTLRTVVLAGTAAVLLTLLVIAVAFGRVARDLARHAEEARQQRVRLDDQATELEQQSLEVELQAATLEEQAVELEQRVTERDDTLRLLEETGAYLDSAVESAPIGVAFLDRQLRFRRVNEALAQMSGTAGAAYAGRTLDEMAPELAGALSPILDRVLRTGVAETDLAVEVGDAGTLGVRRWNVTCYPLRAKGSPPIGVGMMVLDVTERQQLEDQFRQSQKMEAVGRLAGGIAHDFNNVLTIIQGSSDLLAADLGAGAAGLEEVRAIREAADRAAALARQLLSFSRREVAIPRTVDVNAVVGGMQGILERLLFQGVELRLKTSGTPRYVRVDPGQLEQVIMNLVINAVHAMPDGGTLTIRIATAPGVMLPGSKGERPAVGISIADTGTGMTEAVRARLFEPFFTTKPAGEGTGLGLATSYAIVRAADGIVRVETELGRGTRFEILLPLEPDPDRAPDPRHSPQAGSGRAQPGDTILLVEDEGAIRRALSRVLESTGYRVLEASNGAEALRVAGEESGRIDLLLTDVMMPGIGGKELVQRLLAERPGLRVILMSGYTDDDLLRRDLGEARFVFLQKPFAARDAVAAVRELLDAD